MKQVLAELKLLELLISEPLQRRLSHVVRENIDAFVVCYAKSYASRFLQVQRNAFRSL